MTNLKSLFSLFILTISLFTADSQLIASAQDEQDEVVEPTKNSINLRYIGQNSSVASSPNVKHIGLLDPNLDRFQGYNADVSPSSLASTGKVLVALAILDDINTKKYTLSTKVTMPSWAKSTDGNVGTNVRENIRRMLQYSDNSATNVLILQAGGFEGINSKLKKYDLVDSSIKCLLSPKVVTNQSCIGTNRSTMRDLVYAMNLIRVRNTTTSILMVDSMKATNNTFNHTNGVFNKFGINSNALADVGVISVKTGGKRKEYVYAINVDFKGTTDKGSNYKTTGVKNPTNSLTSKKDPVSKAIQWIVNDLEKGLTVREGVD